MLTHRWQSPQGCIVQAARRDLPAQGKLTADLILIPIGGGPA
jgi:hypothetical protein